MICIAVFLFFFVFTRTTFVQEFSFFWVKQPSVTVRVVRDVNELSDSQSEPFDLDIDTSSGAIDPNITFIEFTTPVTVEDVVADVGVSRAFDDVGILFGFTESPSTFSRIEESATV